MSSVMVTMRDTIAKQGSARNTAGRKNGLPGETSVALEGISLSYGQFTAVHDVSLKIPRGHFVTLLGPSGCGKTTLLRSIAGLVQPSSGTIKINGSPVTSVPVHLRNIGFVFQNYALFPHKTIFENVAFGLRQRRVPAEEMARRVRTALDTVYLSGSEKKLPSQLSGGQQQRIALARAFVVEPDVLLLDEPLSALDANLREEMRFELRSIQKKLGITAIFVTHDQEEALSMSDLVIVMNNGRIEQCAAPEDLYRNPATTFVAKFLGQSNFVDGWVAPAGEGIGLLQLNSGQQFRAPLSTSLAGKTQAQAMIPNHLIVLRKKGADGSPAQLTGKIAGRSFLGRSIVYRVDVAGTSFQVIQSQSAENIQEHDLVELAFAPADMILYGKDGRRL